MSAPLLTFDQAIPHLRRGFIVRIHGHDSWQGAQLQEDKGALQLSFGDGKWMQPPADFPVLDLAYDVYDKKVQPSPETQKLESAVASAAPFKVGDRVLHTIDGSAGIIREIDGAEILVHFDDAPSDEDDDMVTADEIQPDTRVELGGGNHPAAPSVEETEDVTPPSAPVAEGVSNYLLPEERASEPGKVGFEGEEQQ